MTNNPNPSQSALAASMNVLDERLRQVEGDLDLECKEMRELVGTNHPEFGTHIARLSDALGELHSSLNDVREKLSLATRSERSPGSEPSAQGDPVPEPRDVAPDNDPSQDMDARTQSHVRHDEKITLSGIFRALLMADEPVQRHERKKLNE